MENEVLKAIKERRSIRRFKADQITDEELKTVLEAGTWAATGHGTQEPFIIAVQNPEICAQLRKMIGLASCWINREDSMFASEEGKKLMKDWNLPEGLMGVGALALGYASAHPHTVKPRKEDYYRIIK